MADDFFVLCWGGRLCRSTFDVGISNKLHRISSVRGTSMSENHDIKLCRHKKNNVAKIGLSGQKWATCRLVGNMSPTFPAKVGLILRTIQEGDEGVVMRHI